MVCTYQVSIVVDNLVVFLHAKVAYLHEKMKNSAILNVAAKLLIPYFPVKLQELTLKILLWSQKDSKHFLIECSSCSDRNSSGYMVCKLRAMLSVRSIGCSSKS